MLCDDMKENHTEYRHQITLKIKSPPILLRSERKKDSICVKENNMLIDIQKER